MHFSILRKSHLLFSLAALALAGTVTGDPPNRPAWWTDEATRVIPLNALENNKGPANIGQAKHMADMALKALATKDQALSDEIRQKLTTRQPDPANPSGPPLKEIIEHDFRLPSPLPPNWAESQRAPLLLGQLKGIAAPFYSLLDAESPTDATWLAAERTANGTNKPGSIFPWTIATDDDANKAIATIGQLKAVFSLRFDYLAANREPNGDFDGDGILNATEVTNGTNPFNIDTDGDGIPDQDDLNRTSPDWTPTPALSLVVLTPLE